MNPNFPVVLMAAVLVGLADKPWLTAVAMVTVVAGGFVIARRAQVRGARWDRTALNYQTKWEN